MKILVGSTSPVKLDCVKRAFETVFKHQNIQVDGVKVSSDVNDQPFNQETKIGAGNRVKNAKLLASQQYDFYVGIEGGIECPNPKDKKITDNFYAFAWVIIENNDHKVGSAKTASFIIPKPVMKHVLDGKELGEADDIVFSEKDSKKNQGCVGLLTNNLITRSTYYKQAVILALIPFFNTNKPFF